MNFIQINFTNWHLVRWIFEVIFEHFEIAFEDLKDQMHRHIVEIIFNWVRTFRAMPYAFIKAGDGFKINGI